MQQPTEQELVDKWVITYIMFPRPVSVGKIIRVLYDSNDEVYAYDIKFDYGCQLWEGKYCKVFNTEKEARKEYDNFVNDSSNFAYEG